MSINVILADDHTLVREGIVSLLRNEEDIRILGQADNGRDILQIAKTTQPDVVVLDVAMPDLNGIDATRQVLKICPAVRVVGLSMHSDGSYIRKMVDAGALGYVLKNSAFRELANAIRTVHKGRRYFSSGLDYQPPSHARKSTPRELTLREREVLQLIAEGRRTSEVAEQLHISVKTVETHRKRIMDKLQLDNVAGLVKYALREGIITLNE